MNSNVSTRGMCTDNVDVHRCPDALEPTSSKMPNIYGFHWEIGTEIQQRCPNACDDLGLCCQWRAPFFPQSGREQLFPSRSMTALLLLSRSFECSIARDMRKYITNNLLRCWEEQKNAERRDLHRMGFSYREVHSLEWLIPGEVFRSAEVIEKHTAIFQDKSIPI